MPKGKPNRKYTGEFKQKVVEHLIKNGLNYDETGRIFEIAGQDRVAAWERIYLEESVEGLYMERPMSYVE